MSSKNENQIYIERRETGDYAVRRGGSERASTVRPNQSDAIDASREMFPGLPKHIERQRHTKNGRPDEWR